MRFPPHTLAVTPAGEAKRPATATAEVRHRKNSAASLCFLLLVRCVRAAHLLSSRAGRTASAWEGEFDADALARHVTSAAADRQQPRRRARDVE